MSLVCLSGIFRAPLTITKILQACCDPAKNEPTYTEVQKIHVHTYYSVGKRALRFGISLQLDENVPRGSVTLKRAKLFSVHQHSKLDKFERRTVPRIPGCGGSSQLQACYMIYHGFPTYGLSLISIHTLTHSYDMFKKYRPHYEVHVIHRVKQLCLTLFPNLDADKFSLAEASNLLELRPLQSLNSLSQHQYRLLSNALHLASISSHEESRAVCLIFFSSVSLFELLSNAPIIQYITRRP